MKLIEKLRFFFNQTPSPKPAFMLFKAVAGNLPSLPPDSVNGRMIEGLLKRGPEDVKWEDIEAGQIALVAVLPLEVLKTKFGSLADEYEMVTGVKPFLHGAFPNPPKTIEGWRAGVVSLIEELAKYRRAKLMFERLRRVVGICFCVPLIASVLFSFLLTYFHFDPPLWRSVVFIGFVGAGFSVLTRLYSLNWSTKVASHIEDCQAFQKGLVLNCLLSLGEGIIGACVIYSFFASGLLTGPMFPGFDEPSTKTDCPFLTLIYLVPNSSAETAKLFLWAFIAGFCERLVPDQLNRLAGEAAAAKGKKQS